MTPVKTASAGFLLALAVAAFVLAGCGGGSSDSSSSSGSDASGSSNPSASGTAASGAAAGETGAGSAASSGNEASGGDGSGAAAPGAIPPSAGGKHGQHIVQPEGAPEPGITPQERKEVTVASMTLQSPSGQPSSEGALALPAEFTCDGKGASPALRWQGVPPGTAELVLFAMNVQPVGGKLFFDWAVAGLSPDLEEIEAGKLPKGAIVGRNSFGKNGYEICPEGAETYIFALFALPQKLSPGQGFDPLAVRKAATDQHGNVGLLALNYARG
jgi:phosphatidylethanolamine-binding protein (PEBP) family uncharacterized protein